MSSICGSFKSQQEDDFEVFWSSPPTPSRKTSRKRFSWTRYKEEKKNPYSNRGLDKYEALLAELSEKRQKIFTQKGSQYISFVHFVYSNSNKAKPIIVRLRDPTKHDQKLDHKQNNIDEDTKNPSLSELQDSTLDITNGTKIGTKEAHHVEASTNKVTNKIRVDQWNQNLKEKLEERWMPSYNLPLFFILVLLFLTFFGRSFAVICTSIAWYLIPKIDRSIENTTAKNIMTKGQHSRKPSEAYRVISSPRSSFSGPMNV